MTVCYIVFVRGREAVSLSSRSFSPPRLSAQDVLRSVPVLSLSPSLRNFIPKGMKTTTVRAVANAIKKAGLIRSDKFRGSSVVKGWHSYIHEGVSFGSITPWKNRYVRNGRYLYWYADKEQEMTVTWQTFIGMRPGSESQSKSDSAAPTNFLKMKEALSAAGIEFEAGRNPYEVFVIVTQH